MSSIRVASLHSDLNFIEILLREACPCKMFTVSFTIYNILAYSSCNEKLSFSIKLLSNSILTQVSNNLDVQIIIPAFFLSFSFMSASNNSCAKETTQRIGVINSCETFEVSKFNRLFFYSAAYNLLKIEMSLIDKIQHSLSLKIRL